VASAGALDDLSSRFRRFALQQAAPSSPFYSRLALGIAEDRSILRLAQQASSVPVTNLFLAAVHDLLLGGADHPLRSFYPDLVCDPQPGEHAFPAFRSFCHTYEAEIVDVVRRRRTQTNEVRRCLYLAPGFSVVGREAGPYAMIDAGASAGLHLLWPRYRYDYEGHVLGDPESPVQLSCRLEGRLRPPLPRAWPEPVLSLGIDLHPLDPGNPDDQRWLRALVWPEHAERSVLLERSLAVARDHPPHVVAGDVFSCLPRLVQDIPKDVAVCVCHNHVVNQFPEIDRVRFDALLGELADGRDLYRLSAEWIGTEQPEFVLSRYRDGDKWQRLLARVDDHGAWIRWADR
jgi:hypothetical protein